MVISSAILVGTGLVVAHVAGRAARMWGSLEGRPLGEVVTSPEYAPALALMRMAMALRCKITVSITAPDGTPGLLRIRPQGENEIAVQFRRVPLRDQGQPLPGMGRLATQAA